MCWLGEMGKRGPVPKRDGQRRRRNKDDQPAEKAPGAAVVEVPAGKRSWHPAALRWYEALAGSGQSHFYEPSDWATAYVIAESMSRDLAPQVIGFNEKTGKAVTASLPINGARLTAYLRAMSSLLVTDGDRRRVRLELERPKGGDDDKGGDNVTWLSEARRGREPG